MQMEEEKLVSELFLKYPSLKLPVVDTFRRLPENIALMEWYATEKLNGTNVSVVMDKSEKVEIFNRTVPLAKQGYIDAVQKVFDNGLGNIMKELLKIQNFERIHVFGELFGAGVMKMNYEHNTENIKDFKVFNVFAYIGDGKYQVLSLKQLQTYFNDYLVPIENVGTLHEMLSLDKDAFSNFGGDREGYVLMPVEHVIYDTNLPSPFFNAIKVKYGKYAEKSRKREKVKMELSDEAQELIDGVLEYVTVARVHNVKSHSELPFDRANIGKWLPLVKEDVFNDYLSEQEDESLTAENLDELLKKNFVSGVLMREISKTIQEAMEQE